MLYTGEGRSNKLGKKPATTKPTTAYTSDVSDKEWDFCRPYLVLMRENAPQRNYSLRELFNALRYIVRCGCQWRMMPHDLPPWQNVYQQAQRWMKACCFEAMAHDLRGKRHAGLLMELLASYRR